MILFFRYSVAARHGLFDCSDSPLENILPDKRDPLDLKRRVMMLFGSRLRQIAGGGMILCSGPYTRRRDWLFWLLGWSL
jgi:hypothetical protein